MLPLTPLFYENTNLMKNRDILTKNQQMSSNTHGNSHSYAVWCIIRCAIKIRDKHLLFLLKWPPFSKWRPKQGENLNVPNLYLYSRNIGIYCLLRGKDSFFLLFKFVKGHLRSYFQDGGQNIYFQGNSTILFIYTLVIQLDIGLRDM